VVVVVVAIIAPEMVGQLLTAVVRVGAMVQMVQSEQLTQAVAVAAQVKILLLLVLVDQVWLF
jgi:hypothetical protein